MANDKSSRMCKCGVSFTSEHASTCLRCMVAVLAKPAKTKETPKFKRPRQLTTATAGIQSKSKANQRQKIVVRIVLPGELITAKPVAPVRREIVCVLCGEAVRKGTLLRHKLDRHGEMEISPSPEQDHKGGYVKVFQGGLPSLGKNSR